MAVFQFSVPFDTDDVKKEYLKGLATCKICCGCDYNDSSCVLEENVINRNIVPNVQDLVDISFTCPNDPKKTLQISKFFLPNSVFEEKYVKEVLNVAGKKMNINGGEILNEILKWGRLYLI